MPARSQVGGTARAHLLSLSEPPHMCPAHRVELPPFSLQVHPGTVPMTLIRAVKIVTVLTIINRRLCQQGPAIS